ncbi:DNA adenine methylase [Clostridium tetani]|uniref:Site-specific DNA-methyltransferase (adenine-specific) n=1 Tax=Clostridium tetani (strain Massachusetts / E88) TaxID=212717 RepID=Q898Q6_CLOTE|nr:DNA adenine methylase [Clostridium tetani]AAO35023.1 putative adenine-specific DNA methyltransferase [Clostridium tetani E88]KGI40816.1 modification methylase [Clostridium tetani]KGI44292.1 modification methylase [Clostridium tetani]KHO38163.1 modification methylase [Clostridium tetani]KIG20445.1 modification methylase [Clostridium tetani]
MKKNKIILAAPVLKWVGGKRQLMGEIKKVLPKTYTAYYEPFIGGGAVLFELQPNKAVINDVNGELINLYNIIKYDVESLIEDLRKHENTSEYFYRIREIDRSKEEYEKLTNVEKASRIIYLNKTCFNGLFRVNKAGEFNSPFGKYKNPNIVDEVTLRAVNKYFNKANIKILNGDFEQSLKRIRKGAFVYLDPPYDPVSSSANFTGYDKGGFNRAEQIRLKNLCDKLDKKGVKFLLSNSATDFIKELYKDYNIKVVKAKRTINSNGNSRGAVDEVLVRNYE